VGAEAKIWIQWGGRRCLFFVVYCRPKKQTFSLLQLVHMHNRAAFSFLICFHATHSLFTGHTQLIALLALES
jgi:hypothetical protein